MAHLALLAIVLIKVTEKIEFVSGKVEKIYEFNADGKKRGIALIRLNDRNEECVFIKIGDSRISINEIVTIKIISTTGYYECELNFKNKQESLPNKNDASEPATPAR